MSFSLFINARDTTSNLAFARLTEPVRRDLDEVKEVVEVVTTRRLRGVTDCHWKYHKIHTVFSKYCDSKNCPKRIPEILTEF